MSRNLANGDTFVSPAKTQLKRLADQLSDEDAGLLVLIGRNLARRRKASIPTETPTPEEAVEIRPWHLQAQRRASAVGARRH